MSCEFHNQVPDREAVQKTITYPRTNTSRKLTGRKLILKLDTTEFARFSLRKDILWESP